MLNSPDTTRGAWWPPKSRGFLAASASPTPKLARRYTPAAGEIPDYVRLRLMSVRAYDASHQMTDAAVCPGETVAGTILDMFENLDVAYIHLHNAKRGCFSCRVDRI